jgi:hypothetical protein
MRRWHAEQDLMLRRWRKELAKHGDGHPHSKYHWGYPHDALASPSIACDVRCHCAAGIGTMRKNRLDCGRPRCGLCHWDKFYEPKRRGATKRSAITLDLELG